MSTATTTRKTTYADLLTRPQLFVEPAPAKAAAPAKTLASRFWPIVGVVSIVFSAALLCFGDLSGLIYEQDWVGFLCYVPHALVVTAIWATWFTGLFFLVKD